MVDPDRLVSCPHCFKHRLSLILSIKQDHSTTSRSCQKCSDFEYNSSNSSVKINLNYLNIIPTIRTIFLCATRINKVYYLANITNLCKPKREGSSNKNHLLLICSSQYAVYYYLKKKWSKKETIIFFKIMCIKESRIANSLIEAEYMFRTNESIVNTIYDLPLPPMWRSSLTLDLFIDTPSTNYLKD